MQLSSIVMQCAECMGVAQHCLTETTIADRYCIQLASIAISEQMFPLQGVWKLSRVRVCETLPVIIWFYCFLFVCVYISVMFSWCVFYISLFLYVYAVYFFLYFYFCAASHGVIKNDNKPLTVDTRQQNMWTKKLITRWEYLNVTWPIVLSVYILTLIHRYPLNRKQSHWHKVNLIQLKTFELKLDFAQYIQYSDVRIVDLCWTAYIPSTTAGFFYINLQL